MWIDFQRHNLMSIESCRVMWRGDADRGVRRGDVARYACGTVCSELAHAAGRAAADPRSGRDDSFAFQWHLEQALYGGATGGLYRLLQRASSL